MRAATTHALLALLTSLVALSPPAQAEGDASSSQEASSGGVLADEVNLDDLDDLVPLSEATGLTVQDIRILGLGRTSPGVVERELYIARGQLLREEDLTESIQRLWNTALFRDVRYQLTRAPEGGVVVWLAVGERWTTIPIVKFGGGGGSTYFIVGVYDPNAFGEYIELGGQYQNTNLNTHSGVVWFREPRFLGLRLRWSAELWYTNIVRPLYRDGTNVLEGGYNQERLQVFNAFDYEVVRYVQVGVGFEFDNDRFNTRNLTEDQQAANDAFGLDLPSGGRTSFAEARLILGRLDRDEFLFQGVQMTNRFKRASKLIGSELNLNFIHSETLAFLRLPWRSNLATRVTVGHNNTDADQHLFFIGGLDYMRGYFDGQLRGHNFWQANVEYRIPSVDTSWVVLQHVGFADVGDVSDSFADLATFERAPRTSLGLGVRLMSPRIYRLTVRFDYAVTLENDTPQAISFSAAQFF